MKDSIREKIEQLKRERNAVILAHNYQTDEVQQIGDFLGDSLDLSRRAAESDAEVIVFCGVRFMAETASILCPDKVVLMPDAGADCPMARMITAAQLRELKGRHPGAVVVCYVNSSAEVKAESGVCCTSANAEAVINSVEKDRPVIFVPDKYLGTYAASRTERELILVHGYCPTHMCILPDDITRLRERYPGAKVMVHPECTPEVTAIADVVTSTSGMCRYAGECDAKVFIVGTEVGLLHRLRRENPSKDFIPASEQAVCPNMKLHTPEKVLWALEDLQHEVRVPEDIQRKARRSLDRMLSIR